MSPFEQTYFGLTKFADFLLVGDRVLIFNFFCKYSLNNYKNVLEYRHGTKKEEKTGKKDTKSLF